MKIDAIDIRVGNVIEYNKKLWSVMKTMHTQPGKGGAYIQVEMKCITSSTKTNVRFRSSESIDKVRLDQKDYQFLYINGDKVELMDSVTYEQISLDKGIFGDDIPFLAEEMMVKVEFFEEKALSASLPDTLKVSIEECEPVIKGQTATGSYKPAILKNGVRIMVPPFVNVGDEIIIKLDGREYKERA